MRHMPRSLCIDCPSVGRAGAKAAAAAGLDEGELLALLFGAGAGCRWW